jgi:hypothetical protein
LSRYGGFYFAVKGTTDQYVNDLTSAVPEGAITLEINSALNAFTWLQRVGYERPILDLAYLITSVRCTLLGSLLREAGIA